MDVLVGNGGSEQAMRALDRTIERAEDAGDSVTVAIVDNPAVETPPQVVEELVRDRLKTVELPVTVQRLEGDPGPTLAAFAERESFDQLVLGDGNRTPLGKIKLDDMTQFVLFNSHVTVVLVR